MILEEHKFGYDPDNYDDEPSDYVNSDNAYDADDLSRDSAEEFEENDDLVGEEADDEFAANDDDDDLDELDDETLNDDTDVDEDDPINDDVNDYPSSTDPAAFNEEGRKPVYIKDMPYIDHATPGVTSH